MTNGDKVREMTDEELLDLKDTPCSPRRWDLFKKGIRMSECPKEGSIIVMSCKECWELWMKEEAQDG